MFPQFSKRLLRLAAFGHQLFTAANETVRIVFHFQQRLLRVNQSPIKMRHPRRQGRHFARQCRGLFFEVLLPLFGGLKLRIEIAEPRRCFRVQAHLLHQGLPSRFDVFTGFRQGLLQCGDLVISGNHRRLATIKSGAFHGQYGRQVRLFGFRLDHAIFHQILLTNQSLQI